MLSHCPSLLVSQATDRCGRRWALIGLAAQTEPSRDAPREELAALATDDVAALYESWAGRWALIGETSLHGDAAGSFGCFYLDGGPWASSSLALLSQLGGREEPGSRRFRLVKGDGFNYDPPPRSCYAGILKLLPTQWLELASGRPHPRAMPSLREAPPPYDEALDRMAEFLVTAFRNIADDDKRLMVALSAGYHSRVLLAAAAKSGVAFETYTQTFPLMLLADRELPPRLSEEVGIRHSLYRPQAALASLSELLDVHSHGLFMDTDRRFFIHQQWTWSQPDDIFIRGRGFELGECFEWWRLPETPSIEAILTGFRAEQAPDYVKQSITEYLAWTAQHPLPGVDWRDRWYLDIRQGGWASNTEQSLSLAAGTSYAPANSARFYRHMLQLPLEKRRPRQHLVDLIDRLCPALNAFPFNPPDGPLRASARQLRMLSDVLRRSGPGAAAYQVSKALRRRLLRFAG